MTVGDFVLQDGQKVVMIGDSITDCGCRGAAAPLGDGYVKFIASLAAAKHPERQIEFINSGVSGDTIAHLAERWDADVLAHRPDWLSVAIGINDVWRQLDKQSPGVLIDEYTATFRDLLERTRASVARCGLILMTTSFIGETPDSEGNRLLEPYNEAIERLAGKFNAFVVPVHQACMTAIAAGGDRKWSSDGVHLNYSGHALMALTWLRTLGW